MPGRVNFNRGTQTVGIIKDESRHDPFRGFAGGCEMETLSGFGLAGVASNTIAGACPLAMLGQKNLLSLVDVQ